MYKSLAYFIFVLFAVFVVWSVNNQSVPTGTEPNDSIPDDQVAVIPLVTLREKSDEKSKKKDFNTADAFQRVRISNRFQR